MTKHNVGDISEFPENKGKKVEIDGIEVAIFNIDGSLYGIQNMCPHKRLPLHIIGEDRIYSDEIIKEGLYDRENENQMEDENIRGGINSDEPSINCPWHYLEFDLETGENEVTEKCIATYDVEIGEQGNILVEI